MSHRRKRRRGPRSLAHAPAAPQGRRSQEVVREAIRVERLAYTRTQAAVALGVSRSTFDRRVLPLIETVELPWGTRLVPVDELERLVAERRRPPETQPKQAERGRPHALSPNLIDQIRAQRESGRSLREIAADLNDRGVPTTQGGTRWWASTIRAVLAHSEHHT